LVCFALPFSEANVYKKKFAKNKNVYKFQAILGKLPEGFYRYFASRFPRLLIEVYKVMWLHCKDEEAFSKYFDGSSV